MTPPPQKKGGGEEEFLDQIMSKMVFSEEYIVEGNAVGACLGHCSPLLSFTVVK